MREIYNVREPLITDKPFKYLGRNYKKGDMLDRRRVRILNSRVKALLNKGCLRLAKEMTPKELENIGYIYDNKVNGYFPLFRVEDYKLKFPEKFKPKKKAQNKKGFDKQEEKPDKD